MARTEIPQTANGPAPSPGRGGLAGPAPRRAPVYDVPTLLLELDDERTRARRREGMLVSIIVHLVALLAIVLLPKYVPLRPLLTSPTTEDLLRGRDLTYLSPPPDTQTPPLKVPETKIISDKNRIATSRAPVLDKKALDALRDNVRPGAPGTPSPAPQASAGLASAPPAGSAEQTPPGNQVASLQPPPLATKGTFGGGMSAGSAIEQAARAAARGGSGGPRGRGGDYGLGPGASQGRVRSEYDVLSDTMGVDFGPYLARVLQSVRTNWYTLIPEVARAPLMKSGKVTIEFAILKDGSVAGMRVTTPSGDISLDRAAWGGITASNPFPPLPPEFRGDYLRLRFHFYYNPGRNELQ
ncbi:MAG: TonB family protein [Terriglobales bacterium]